ncbi:MAG: VOC family protein [Chloroflexi bacterium]|nr:VOC family protein [Chloroflexota bacterium]
MPIPTTKLGHIVLRVRDLERSERFYTQVLGLRKTGEVPGKMVFFSTQGNADSHDLALMRLGADAPAPDPARVGLYHFAYQVESEEALAQAHLALREAGVPIVGSADHGVSKGIYLLDPDGIEIEITYEVPPARWPQDGNPFAGATPLTFD